MPNRANPAHVCERCGYHLVAEGPICNQGLDAMAGTIAHAFTPWDTSSRGFIARSIDTFELCALCGRLSQGVSPQSFRSRHLEHASALAKIRDLSSSYGEEVTRDGLIAPVQE